MGRKIEAQKNIKTKKLFFNFSVFKSFSQSKIDGFTLIELLVVMAILAVLLALVLVAVNPVRQAKQANNTQRRNDINAILNAIYQYTADNGSLPSGITTSMKSIGTTAGACDGSACGSETLSATCYDITSALTTTYLVSIPYDPTTGSDSDTRYGVKKSASNDRVTVRACDAELSVTIEAIR